jgi:hypothetical protein
VCSHGNTAAAPAPAVVTTWAEDSQSFLGEMSSTFAAKQIVQKMSHDSVARMFQEIGLNIVSEVPNSSVIALNNGQNLTLAKTRVRGRMERKQLSTSQASKQQSGA